MQILKVFVFRAVLGRTDGSGAGGGDPPPLGNAFPRAPHDPEYNWDSFYTKSWGPGHKGRGGIVGRVRDPRKVYFLVFAGLRGTDGRV